MAFVRCTCGILLAIFLSAYRADATITTWTAGTGDFLNAANWSAGVPDPSNPGEINNGGTAQLNADAGDIGVNLAANFGNSGTLTVSGKGKITGGEVEFGDGTAVLNILSGGKISSGNFVMGINPGSNSTATVSGAGSTWANDVVCFVGSAGTATLNILSGGNVSSTNFSIGEMNGSTGTVLVDGIGSSLTPSSITVGGNGAGWLTIANGAKLDGTDGPDYGGVELGRNPGSSGTMLITGSGSQCLDFAVAVVANNGGTGLLTIGNGGSLTDHRGYIGYSNGGTGNVVVQGAGSAWTNSDTLQIGGSGMFGFTALGTLRITSGGTVTANLTTVAKTGTLEIGDDAHLNGFLMFDGGLFRTTASTTFAKDLSLSAGGMRIDSNGSQSSLSGILSGSGGVTKVGAGTLTLSGANTYMGTTVVSAGTLNLTGSLDSSALSVQAGAQFSGTGTMICPLTVDAGGIVDLNGGTLTVNNSITNNGLFILSNAAQLATVTGFINNGTLDLITAGAFTPPNGFVNSGSIIDSSVVKPSRIQRNAKGFTIWINSYTGHIYHLQRSTSMGDPFTNVSGLAAQPGNTGQEISFSVANGTETQAFYRILVSP